MEISEITSNAVVVVDGANAAASGGCRLPTLARLLAVRAAAVAKWPTAKVVVVVDASLRHKFSKEDQEEMARMCGSGEIIAAPSSTVGNGDAVLLAIAAACDGKIVSNDAFREHVDEFPFLTDDERVFGIVSVDGMETLLVLRKLGASGARL
jgi:hypothetical protein